MVWTRSRATSPGHQESRDASSNPHRDRQSAPVTQPPSIQHIQSMAAAMTELTRQNQELTKEIGLRRQHHERHVEEQTQSQEDRRENAESENQSKGTALRRVPHLEKEMNQMRKVMHEMRETHEKGESCRGFSSSNRLPFHGFHQRSPLTSEVQDAFLGLV